MTASPAAAPAPPGGMRTFVLVWLGSTVSMLGSALSGFVLGVWAFRETGSATLYSLIALAGALPALLLSPLGGALADRWDRRKTMLGATVIAAVTTSILAALLWAGRLEIWHLYVAALIASVVMSVQRPASMAATTVLIPPQHFARAQGMLQFGAASIRIVAPVLAGILLAVMSPQGILLLDIASFLVVLAVLLAVHIPPPPRREGAPPRPTLLRDAGTGWRYIRGRPGIFGLLMYFAAIAVPQVACMVLLTPLMLRISDEVMLGTVMSFSGAGSLAGALLMSAWGGPKRHFHGIVAAGLVCGVGILVMGLRPAPLLIAAGAFAFAFGGPIMTGCFNAIWQTKTPLELHGRVFATILMVAECAAPLALLAAGPAADLLAEPLMQPDGALAPVLGPVLGVGPGRGIGLIYVLMGAVVLAATLVASRLPRLRLAEDEIPDAVAPETPPSPGATPDPEAPSGAGVELSPSA